MTTDRDVMAHAIRLAAPHHPHPNPRVGAVVVDAAGAVIGEGAHDEPGQPHAEVLALRHAGAAARGSTVYVTLEPCAHQGKTAPCTEALIEAGVARVVAAVEDPDAQVAGRGFEELRAAGIEVDVGVGSAEAERLDPGYFHHRRTGRPRVTVKAALTLDGQMAAADGSSQWITSSEMRLDARALRERMDALMVGSGTVLADDPTLDLPEGSPRRPRAFVVEGTRSVPATARLLQEGGVVVTTLDGTDRDHLQVAGDGERVDLAAMLGVLGSNGVVDLLVEGGPTLISALGRLGLIDAYVLYFGAKLGMGVGLSMFDGVFARIEDARRVRVVDVARVGDGVRVDVEPEET